MDSYKKKPLKNCSKCHTERVSTKKIKDLNSNINIAYAPRNCTLIAKDDYELRLRIWSFMSPPKISSPTPIISPCRLEKVRNLLDEKQNFKLTKLDCIGMPKECVQLVEQTRIEKSETPKKTCHKVVHSQEQNKRMFNPCFEAAKYNQCQRKKNCEENSQKLQCNYY